MAKFKIEKLPYPVIITEVKRKDGCLVIKGDEVVDLSASEVVLVEPYLKAKMSSQQEKKDETPPADPKDDFSDVVPPAKVEKKGK